MAVHAMSKVMQRLRSAVLRHGDGITDGQLLKSFRIDGEQAAFETLVRRHGKMVLGVCHRILADVHDAEDAFQATFLVLVRKAGALVDRRTVGDWLYGVAHNTALKARAMAQKRRMKERHVREDARGRADSAWSELQPLLDQELSRLPEKYRVPVVLCDLEGKTRVEAARQLGWPEGTLSGRLSRARVILAKRLARRGFVASGGLLAVILSQHAGSACTPLPLVESTINAAAVAAGHAGAGAISAQVAALTEGVLRTMLLTKLKSIALVLLGVGLLTFVAFSQSTAATEEQDGPRPAKKSAIVQIDLNKLPPDLAIRLLELSLSKDIGPGPKGDKTSPQDSEKKSRKANKEEGKEGSKAKSMEPLRKKAGKGDEEDEGKSKAKKGKKKGGEDDDEDEGKSKAKKGKKKGGEDNDEDEGKSKAKKGKKKGGDDDDEDEGKSKAMKSKKKGGEYNQDEGNSKAKKGKKKGDDDDEDEGKSKAMKGKKKGGENQDEGKSKAKKGKKRAEREDDEDDEDDARPKSKSKSGDSRDMNGRHEGEMECRLENQPVMNLATSSRMEAWLSRQNI